MAQQPGGAGGGGGASGDGQDGGHGGPFVESDGVMTPGRGNAGGGSAGQVPQDRPYADSTRIGHSRMTPRGKEFGLRQGHREREGPVRRPTAASGATRRGPHPTEVDVVTGDQALIGFHGTN
ncbi:hypothetical protein EF905_35620 [Streptomyces sp. WAC05374]|nr:hypothetical protein EF905_35620 [Streptomyces sp. WAC05374]